MGSLITRLNYREQALAALGRIPPFSPVLTRLMATLARDDVSFAELARNIELDTVLAGNVLRLVNSAMYGRCGTVNSVARAISILGLQKLRNVALGLSISKTWTKVRVPASWSTASFNQHSIATAILADQMASSAPVVTPENAFAAGLFHDFGKLMIAVALPDEYTEIRNLYRRGGRTISQCEDELLGLDHETLSGEAVARWKLPPAIHAAVRCHHGEDFGTRPFPLTAVISAASNAADSAGIRTETPPVEPAPGRPEEHLALIAGEQKAGTIWRAFEEEFEPVRKML